MVVTTDPPMPPEEFRLDPPADGSRRPPRPEAVGDVDPEILLESGSNDRPHRLRYRGASLVEYALLIALIALVAMAGVQVMGDAVGSAIDDGASSVQRAGQ